MQDLDKKWHNISIFHSQEQWHSLLKNCLQPLVNQLQSQNLVYSYHIYLSTIRGKNIRLAFWANHEHSQQIFNTITLQVNEYLLNNGAPSPEEQYPVNGFFKNFPNNCIRYNLFNPDYCSLSGGPDYHKDNIQQLISANILDVFGEDTIDMDSLLTYSLYVLFTLVKMAGNDNSKSGRALLEVMKMAREEGTVELITGRYHHIEQTSGPLFSSNKEVLIDICNDIWDGKPGSETLSWINRWEDSFGFILEKQTLKEVFPTVLLTLSQHTGISYNNTLLYTIAETIFKAIEIHTRHQNAPSVSQEGITVILTSWKRDHLEDQIQALLAQTQPPDTIWIYHCRYFNEPAFELTNKYQQVKYQFNTDDLGYFGRFSLGLLAPTPYLLIIDDDVIPSPGWIEGCIRLCEENNAIISSAGRIIPENDYTPERVKDATHVKACFIGDNDSASATNLCPENTQVDYGCNSWLIKTAWLNYFWAIRPYTFETGEDIHLSASCYLQGGIKTICPQQKPGALCGNLQKNYGFDEFASWKEDGFIQKRELILKHWINERGWSPIHWQRVSLVI